MKICKKYMNLILILKVIYLDTFCLTIFQILQHYSFSLFLPTGWEFDCGWHSNLLWNVLLLCINRIKERSAIYSIRRNVTDYRMVGHDPLAVLDYQKHLECTVREGRI